MIQEIFLTYHTLIVVNTTRYAFLENGEAATLDSFFELVERYKQDDISKYKLKDQKHHILMVHHVELMMQNKVQKVAETMRCFIMVCMQNLNGQKIGKQN